MIRSIKSTTTKQKQGPRVHLNMTHNEAQPTNS